MKFVEYPELVFGLAAPLGVDLETVSESLEQVLRSVEYKSKKIRITDVMFENIKDKESTPNSFYEQIEYKMNYANNLCKKYDNPSHMALLAVSALQEKRKQESGDIKKPAPNLAYIIRQLKRPSEIKNLRLIYGKQFILISGYSNIESRKKKIFDMIRSTTSTQKGDVDVWHEVNMLIERDEAEGGQFGQNIRDAFHSADVFIDCNSRASIDKYINRFVKLLFGRADISPTRDEYGMYSAKSASFRSADLSRQVGAAIFSCEGEIITQGCNEVPKAFGGTYWDDEEPDFRDVKLGHDPNEGLKKYIVKDIIERLMKGKMFSDDRVKGKSSDDVVEELIDKNRDTGILADAKVMDLTEYGRVVHAEMCAICDAARIGRSVRGATLYCTTFPCHNCTKHIIASGIRRVVYIEPYPKSKAQELHGNELSIESESDGKVSFVPFVGVSPFRYRDLYQKGKRKSSDGTALRWLEITPKPIVEAGAATYISIEFEQLSKLVGEFKK